MENSERQLRIGAVSYLNTKPLVEGLTDFLPGASLEFDLPSRLADSLSRGDLDVALIPVVEYFRSAGHVIVSDACIASRGSVWSVRLLFRVPPAEVRTLALDEGSRTSAALCQILLWERFGIRPKLSTLPMDAPWRDAQADAVLIIGDRAMGDIAGGFVDSWDIGQEWRTHTGFPCVFAVWVAREGCDVLAGVDLQEVAWGLSAARDLGRRCDEQIAACEAARYGLTEVQCLRYFREHLNFVLGENERHGLERFYRSATQLGLAPSGKTPFRYTVSIA